MCIFGPTYMFTLVALTQPHKWQFALWAKHLALPFPKV